MKKWKLAAEKKIPKEFERAGLNPITSRLLLQRNIATPQDAKIFFANQFEDLADPWLLTGMKEAVERIRQAKEKNEKLVVFGDYDADGLTASTILKETLEQIGFDVPVYIPDRNKEGYGLNKAAIDFIKSNYQPNLIITVDCGISNREEIAYAQQKGIEIIVTDHHAIPKKVPENCILINPKLKNEKYSFSDLAGVGVAFKFSQAIIDDFLPQKKEQMKWLLDLVAIGTIADCVPLIGENRIFAKFGLIVLQKTKRAGLLEIIQTARLPIGEKNPPNAENIAFQIGPRLNASGRMDHADLTLNLLLEKDRAKARILALEVENKNTERQKVSLQVYNEAKKSLGEREDHKLIVKSGKHWPLGIVGVVAGKICEEFHCPVFLFREGDEIFEGSGRSIEAFDIVSAVGKIDDLVDRYGGHAQAMGMKLKPENITKFEKAMLGLIEKEYDEEGWGRKLHIDLEINPEQIDWDLHAEIRKFEPFGEKNREPVFLARNMRLQQVKMVGNGQKHLKFLFGSGTSKFVEGIFWKSGDRYSEFERGGIVDVVFQLRSNEWNGNRKLELNIIDMKIS
jgi:single-stranded-DNA-specific exonuclease